MANQQDGKERSITVNNNTVTIASNKATGLEIKQSAIDQGVAIQIGFSLKVQTKDGGWEAVSDDKEIVLNKQHLTFRAIEGDENS